MAAHANMLRLVDANINRTHEGLRVCEDLARFYFKLAPSYRRLRRLRHAFDHCLQQLPVPPEALVRVRNSRLDPGRRAEFTSVRSAEHLLVMNLQRAKEACRVLEESVRLLAPKAAPAFQTVRFKLYDVERNLLLRVAALRHRRRRRLCRP